MGLQDFWSSCLWVTLEGGKHLAVSVSNRKLLAPISPAPAALSALKLWVEPPLESPQVGTVPPAADKQALAERAGPTSAPLPVSWALEDLGCNAHEGRKQGSSDLHFLSPNCHLRLGCVAPTLV